MEKQGDAVMSYRSWFIVLAAFFFVVGCNVSFNSSQYSFIKSLFDSEPPPPKLWSFVWGEIRTSMFAINHDSGIYFVSDTGLLVSFDGWQVISVRMPANEIRRSIFAKKTSTRRGEILIKFTGYMKQPVGSQECQSWVRLEISESQSGWEQTCRGARQAFQNRIFLNESGEIVELEFYLEPNTNALKLAFEGSAKLKE